MPRVHAFGDDALGDHDAVGLAEAIRAGRVGAAEVVEAAIARTEAVNPALNGLAYNAFEQARRAASATRRRLLRRRPDVHQGQRRRRRPADHAGRRRVDPVRRAPPTASSPGCIWPPGRYRWARRRLSEFGFSAAAEHPRLGPVRNPWNTDYTAGASSSGSGAFVAAGVVPIAHANDGGGSIRIPAACNGLVGLKPSRGRLPLDAAAAPDAGGHRHQRCADPFRARHRGLLSGGRAHLAQPQAGADRRRHRPGRQRLRIAVLTRSVLRECSPKCGS